MSLPNAKNSPETYFHVSPFLNLYYSLEVSTGTIMAEYNEEYAKSMGKVFPKRILDKFTQLHNEQMFSWKIKSCLLEEISESKLKASMRLLASQFNDLLNEAFTYYQAYWKRTEPSLMKAREALDKSKNEFETLLATTSNLLRIPWRVDKLYIQLVDPFTGEPMGKNVVSLGIGSIASMSSTDLTAVAFFFILHEATHILVWDTVRRIAEKYTTEEHAEYVDEAVMNLISDSVLKREEHFHKRFLEAMKAAEKMKFPPPSHIEQPKTPSGEICKARHEKRNKYISYYRKMFQNDWEELLARNEPFSNIIDDLVERNIEGIGKQ